VIEVAAAVLQRPDGAFLLAQRPAGKVYAGYWEFPGGKIEPDEAAPAALARELREEMAIGVEVGDRVIHVEHAYESYDIDFCVYRCRLVTGPIQNLRVHAHRWVRPDELDQYEFPAADEKTIAKLLGL
jgi:8-oxo-dGTP diphosphatase